MVIYMCNIIMGDVGYPWPRYRSMPAPTSVMTTHYGDMEDTDGVSCRVVPMRQSLSPHHIVCLAFTPLIVRVHADWPIPRTILHGRDNGTPR